MGEIHLEGLEFFAHHGFHQEEQKLGNRYIVDILLKTDFGVAATEDQLAGTVDYESIYRVVSGVMNQKSKLLEHLAYLINQSILQTFSQVSQVEVKVSKFNPPIGGICAKASVRLKSTR
ncbi:MAG: dihydroneopterin aldolase [Cyclobacteriaceae bacterium]